ncbi:MAG: Nramp family divalent metal transporter, partial [Phycisphaerales bacterium]|nr:Nramp family divalent metal transporter [Phycisphaerales bacterium]
MPNRPQPHRILAAIGPGLLVAATGVGAGDLATAGFAGSRMGIAVLWAVALGALLKFALTEGIARHQLATNDTLLEGACRHLGRWVGVVFLVYLLPWSFFTGGALVNAAGAAAHAIVPVFERPAHDKVLFGIASSAAGLLLVWLGGFRVFERVMAACVAIMFLCVVLVGAWLLLAERAVGAAVVGLLVPRIPHDAAQPGSFHESLSWTLALLGGVGGTVTILCYGYWMREENRSGHADLRLSRWDLGVGYLATALFGMAMIVIANGTTIEGKGVALIARLGDHLGAVAGPVVRWGFLIGAWAAVASSLLGVWQSVPYLFADTLRIVSARRAPTSTDRSLEVKPERDRLDRTIPYRAFLLAIATLPLVTLWIDFKAVQKTYAIAGAFFLPLLAAALLVLNRRAVVGATLR